MQRCSPVTSVIMNPIYLGLRNSKDTDKFKYLFYSSFPFSRPKSMNDIASQSTVVSVLRQSLQSDNVPISPITILPLTFTLVATFAVLWATRNG